MQRQQQNNCVFELLEEHILKVQQQIINMPLNNVAAFHKLAALLGSGTSTT